VKKRYKISYDGNFDMIVEIDHDACKDALLHEINNFWSDSEHRLTRADGNIVNAVLTLMAQMAFRLNVSDWRNTVSLLKDPQTCPEGWPVLDGSSGITLVSIDDFEFEADEFTIEEKTA
jgi:hypothetical protein